jgi:hypothetical protein
MGDERGGYELELRLFFSTGQAFNLPKAEPRARSLSFAGAESFIAREPSKVGELSCFPQFVRNHHFG